jgi:LCP family protein required for cell wall assembly
MFKNKKIKSVSKLNNKNKIKRRKILWLITWFIAVITVFIIWKIIISALPLIEIGFDAMWGLDDNKIELPVATDWKIKILLTGKWGWDHEAPDLTDTMILLGIDKELKTVSMFSIPRDMYVKYPHSWEWKLNEVYYRWLKYYKGDESKAMTDLINKVKQITWEEVNYYANIDFAGFTKIIDALWWVEVNVPVDLKDTAYPDGNYWYEVFEIKKGLQTFDWETALKYARSRHSTSDFDRSLRQQLIISAIKDKVNNLWYLSNSGKIRWLYYTIKDNLKTNMWIGQIIDLALLAKDIDRNNIKSFNLNDSCFFNKNDCVMWGFMYYPPREDFKWLSVTLPFGADITNLENYTEIQKYTNLIFNYPEIFIDKHEVNVFNATKSWWLATHYANSLLKYWFNIPEVNSVWNARDKSYPKTVIYYNNIDKDDKTLEALWLFIFWEQVEIMQPQYSKNPNTKIEIIIWDDYKNIWL